MQRAEDEHEHGCVHTPLLNAGWQAWRGKIPYGSVDTATGWRRVERVALDELDGVCGVVEGVQREVGVLVIRKNRENRVTGATADFDDCL
jgi:hypothetical protein